MGLTELPLDKAASILKLLGDRTRLTMLKMLQSNDCCVCEFVSVFNTSQPAISQHLRKLRDSELVKETRKGQWIFYSLNKESENYQFVLSLLDYLPSQEERIKKLEEQGLRILCD